MEAVMKINNFDSLDERTQQDIQDFISGLTTEWEIELFSHCDVCCEESSLNKIETEGGIIRVCDTCNKKRISNVDKSLLDYKKKE